MKGITIKELISSESLQQRVREIGPICTLLDKPARRKYSVRIDYDGRFRGLPSIGISE